MRQANFSYLLSRVELCLIGYLFLEIPFKLFAQQPGNASATESWPHLKVTSCSKMGCRDLKTHLTMDADRRPLVDVNGTSSCLSSNITWNEKICSDPKSCSKNCALGKVNYTESEVISTQGHSVTLKLFNKEKQDGTRFYVMDSKELYKLFQLKNQEVSFEVDVSNAPAGVNAALYFVGMEADGGKSKANQAGAPYGTGFCSSKCPTNLRFVNGKANVLVPTLIAPITNFGTMGSCCPEVDVWQANQVSQTFSAHPCISNKPVTCHGMSCKPDTLCASSHSCDFSSLRAADRNFYGTSKTINTMKKFRVVTQFITDDGTSSGDLVEIRRLYVQDDKVIENTRILVPRQSFAFNSVTDEFCSNSTAAIQQKDSFKYKGGLEALGRAMDDGMVMVLSLSLGDVSDQILKDPKSSALALVKSISNITEQSHSNQKNISVASVTFSHIKIGPLNATLKVSILS
ncbi:glycoside hydrolase [Phakopsora pachyrhizi]|nr:glycoside hydrolase [Phakopsora pachyrhizi]